MYAAGARSKQRDIGREGGVGRGVGKGSRAEASCAWKLMDE